MGSVKLYYLADTNKMVEGCFPDKSVQHWRKDEDFAALEENHAAEVSTLREMAEDVMLMSDDLGLDTETPEAIISATSDKVRLAVRALLEERDSLRSQLEAAKAELETVRAESVEAHDANTALRSELADLKYFYLSRVEGEPRAIVPTSFKGNVQTVEAQLTAQPDGVRELCECGHPLDVHRGINGCLADWEKPGFELGCRCKKFKLTTPAASTPPEVSALRERVAELEGKVRACGVVIRERDNYRAQLEAALAAMPMSYKSNNADEKLAQLTAQPDGVPCMGECGQEAWAIHYKDAVKQALEELQDREFSGAKRTLEEALRGSTRAASTPPEGKVREALADHEHHRWSKWMAYLFSKCVQHPDGSKTIPAEWAHRWMLQTMTPYRDLTEREKDSDRAEVDEAEAVRSQALAAPAPACKCPRCWNCDEGYEDEPCTCSLQHHPDCNAGEGEK